MIKGKLSIAIPFMLKMEYCYNDIKILEKYTFSSIFLYIEVKQLI